MSVVCLSVISKCKKKKHEEVWVHWGSRTMKKGSQICFEIFKRNIYMSVTTKALLL
jgi:hypothetical protein